MSCPVEQVWVAYVDGECPRADLPELEAHLAVCPSCRGLARALAEENRLLEGVLAEVPQLAPARLALPGWAAAAGALVLLALGVQLSAGWLAGLGSESPLGLVDERQIVLGLFVETVLYMLRQGASMLESVVTTFVLPGAILLGAVAALTLRRRWAGGALSVVLLLVLAEPSSALELRHPRGKHDRVVVGAEETIDDSLAVAGDAVLVEGTVTGNLIVAARRVLVRGSVRGDLVAVAEKVEIEGVVDGNVFAAGDTVVVRGSVGRSLHGAGGTLLLESSGRVEGDLFGAAGNLDLDGRVGRDLLVASGLVNLRGVVGRNASVRSGRLLLDAPARIGGKLVSVVHEAGDLQMDPGAVVSGEVETRVLPKQKSRYARPGFYLWRLVWLIAAFLAGLALRALVPGLFPPRVPAGAALLRAAGVGFLALVAVPAAAVILMITLVGLPIGLVLFAVWLAGLYVAHILVASLVGRALLRRAEAPPAAFAPVLLVGLLAVTIAANLPYVDGLVRLFVLVVGLGLAVVGLYRSVPRGVAV